MIVLKVTASISVLQNFYTWMLKHQETKVFVSRKTIHQCDASLLTPKIPNEVQP